jgi:hypothetical protein
MDTGKGTFEQVQQSSDDTAEKINAKMRALEAANPNHGGWFREGEVVELKGSMFRVKRIKPTEITLKLLVRKP